MASTEQQFDGKHDAALARLALQISPGKGGSIVGAEPNDEELAALYESRLDNVRRAQILSHIANSQTVYDRWIRCVEAITFMEEIESASTVNERAAQKDIPESSVGFFKSLFSSPAGIFGGGLATAAIIVLAVFIAPTMQSEFDFQAGIDGAYRDWGNNLDNEWAALPSAAKPKPKLSQRGFFSKPKSKSDIQKVLETGLKAGVETIGTQPLIDLGIEVKNLSSVHSAEVTSLTSDQYSTVYETGRLVAVLAPQCHIDPDSERISNLIAVLDILTRKLALISVSEISQLLQGVKDNSNRAALICSLSDNVIALLTKE